MGRLENKIAVMLTGEEIIEQSGAHSANMQSPSGTGRKTHPNFSFYHLF